jgi:hypothetical protein
MLTKGVQQRKLLSARVFFRASSSDEISIPKIKEEHLLAQNAKALRISHPGRHIFLCCDQTKAKCCTKEEGIVAWDYLKGRIKASCKQRSLPKED